MLRILAASSREGRKELEALFGARRTVDFAGLRDALPIVEEVLAKGESALRHFVRELDGFVGKDLLVDPRSVPEPDVHADFVVAFRRASRRIAAYHRKQVSKGFAFRDASGVSFEERPLPHACVGVYVPGGRAFYPSSLLMGVVPAKVAGVPRVVVATPPRAWEGSAELRWAVCELGVSRVLLAGGAHAIAGLVTVAGCTKVVGPGNRWVAAAKHLVSSLVSVDLPAGPSEVLILASKEADPASVAADLIAQAEHDPQALCLLFTDDALLARCVAEEVEGQLASLSTAPVARKSIDEEGRIFVFGSLEKAAEAGVLIAAEHVQLMGKRAERHANRMAATAGALFVGSNTPTAFGDYIAGPNHVLPTGGAARSFSGLSTRDFVRFSRRVSLGKSAARRLAPFAMVLARFEGLEGHVRSLERRLR